MKRILSVFLVVLPLGAQGPAAPATQALSGVVRLNKLPISEEVLQVKLPRPVERPLSNGLKLLVVESHRVPNITLQIRIPTGDLRNPPELLGLSDATAALLRLGTKTMNSKAIADRSGSRFTSCLSCVMCIRRF